MVTNVSEHFSLEELTCSQTAARNGIDNTPDETVKAHLKVLCDTILEPVRELLGCPLHVNSAYRCWKVNTLVNGSKTSQHPLGGAADIVPTGIGLEEAFDKRLNNAISRLGVPSRNEVKALQTKVDSLTKQIEKLTGQSVKPVAKAAAKPAAKVVAKPAAKPAAKAPAKPAAKAAAKPAAAKPAPATTAPVSGDTVDDEEDDAAQAATAGVATATAAGGDSFDLFG